MVGGGVGVQTIGNGWTVWHETERTLELRKDSYEYRRYTGGRDGFVLVRGEPGIPRHVLYDRAMKDAQKTDEMLAERLASDLLPTRQALATYAKEVNVYVPVMSTGEEEFCLGRKRA
jgi:hypothetical protein